MYPLIEIKTVPIEVRVKTKSASLEYTRGTAEMEISRTDGGDLDIKSRPIKLQMDSFEPRGEAQSFAERASREVTESQPTYQATASYVQSGELMLNAKVGQDSDSQFTAGGDSQDSPIRDVGPNLQPLPGIDMDFDEGDMEIRYEMDKMNIDWKIEQGELKFTPGDIEIEVEQQPRVVIKYVGGPLYVPPSSDPDYTPVDVKA